jgi:glycine rich protein/HYR domain-containing protein
MACGGLEAARSRGAFVGKTLSVGGLVRPRRRRVMALVTGAGITAAMAVGVPAAATAATAAAAAAAAAAVPMDLPAACTPSPSWVDCTYTYTGGEQDFLVPAGVNQVSVLVTGAFGGGYPDALPFGGAGEQVDATLTVTPGTTLYVEVGGQGLDTSTTPGVAAQAGGFNGGGASSASDSASYAPASGGGASDIRTISSADPGSLASRLIVGGGGGGAGSCGSGGNAGTPGVYNPDSWCTSMTSSGGGAGTTVGGTAGGPLAAAGVLGLGGYGGPSTPPATADGDGGGGGGGGWYGGGGGGPQAGGGGGSSYVPVDGLAPTTPYSAASVDIGYQPATATLSIATHQNITVDATSAAGAVVHYIAPKVTDQANPTDPPKAVCTPPSGSTFAIGTTTVTCTATDAADSNSPVSSTFTVTVVGAPGQLHVLHYAVRDYGPALANTVLIAEHAVNTENPQRACLPLDAFIVEVATRIPPLPPVTRAYLIAAAGQIRAVLGCGDSWLP